MRGLAWNGRVNCSTHPVVSEVWVCCVHVDAIRRARRSTHSARGVVGSALCPECEAADEAGRLLPMNLQLACGNCVRKR